MDDYDEYEELRRALSPQHHQPHQHPSGQYHVEVESDNCPTYDQERAQDYSDLEDSFDQQDDLRFDEKYDEQTYELEEDQEDEKYEGGFGLPPTTRQLRRNKTNRRVQLTKGNLVLDCLIPTRLAGFLPRKDEDEFKYTRYTAVTCGPESFEANEFALRPALLNRETEMMVVITLYNENEELFLRTLHGIMKNISHLCTRNKSKTWGPEGWKKVVVCIVADGRRAINPRILDCLSALGVYQEGMAKNMVDNKAVVAHLYEYTTQLSISSNLTFQGLEKGIVPCQLMFCLKEKNAKKINSHRWALEAFASMLNPNVVVLLDVGTKPLTKSLYHLWKTFDLNSNVAGACGEITVMKGKLGKNLLNPLVAAQNFEYKMSNILDKPLESVFGYISVLPGAFSAYRFIALKNDALGNGPLASYFKGETLAGAEADVFTSNMYLAEDRILAFEIVAKSQSNWVLKFVKNAQGETDVPDTIVEFISQRRRWLNGSFFASVYSLTHTAQFMASDHSTGRKVALLFEAFYNFLNLLFSWFGIGNYYIFLMVLTSSLESPAFSLPHINIPNAIVQYTYAGTIVATFIMSLGNRVQGSRIKYMIAIVLFAITTAYMYGAAAFCIVAAVKQSEETLLYAEIVISLIATYGVYVMSSVLALDPWHLVTSMPQYMLFAPVYINLLNIFAFSNLHDFSWGTKEQHETQIDLGVASRASPGKNEVEIVLPTGQEDIDSAYDHSLHLLKTRPPIIPPPKTLTQKGLDVQDYYRNVRTNVLLSWVLSNGLLVCTILNGDYSNTFDKGGNRRVQIYMVIILFFVAGMSLVRFAGSTAHRIIGIFDR